MAMAMAIARARSDRAAREEARGGLREARDEPYNVRVRHEPDDNLRDDEPDDDPLELSGVRVDESVVEVVDELAHNVEALVVHVDAALELKVLRGRLVLRRKVLVVPEPRRLPVEDIGIKVHLGTEDEELARHAVHLTRGEADVAALAHLLGDVPNRRHLLVQLLLEQRELDRLRERKRDRELLGGRVRAERHNLLRHLARRRARADGRELGERRRVRVHHRPRFVARTLAARRVRVRRGREGEGVVLDLVDGLVGEGGEQLEERGLLVGTELPEDHAPVRHDEDIRGPVVLGAVGRVGGRQAYARRREVPRVVKGLPLPHAAVLRDGRLAQRLHVDLRADAVCRDPRAVLAALAAQALFALFGRARRLPLQPHGRLGRHGTRRAQRRRPKPSRNRTQRAHRPLGARLPP
mmetsp:Transcript_12626/g.39746  ORF Transcript_12626/g.39746 Transcript_12626/m.39746 type:complete len:410 (-) Transcript_12626:70-1299(-)